MVRTYRLALVAVVGAGLTNVAGAQQSSPITVPAMMPAGPMPAAAAPMAAPGMVPVSAGQQAAPPMAIPAMMPSTVAPPPAVPGNTPPGAASTNQAPGQLPTSPPLTGPQFDFLAPAPTTPEPKNWCAGLEIGVSGADGNSQIFRLILGAEAQYVSPQTLFRTSFLYNYANVDSGEVQNMAYWYTRFERLFPDTPWSIYGTNTLEYDRFLAFDVRLSGASGVGCAIWKTDRTLVKGRLGAGSSREFQGDDEFRPEANFGADVEQRVGDRSKFVSRFDYYPDISDWRDYRVELQAAFETLLSVEHNLFLKLGALDRYDRTPTGKRPNDINYAATLLWRY